MKIYTLDACLPALHTQGNKSLHALASNRASSRNTSTPLGIQEIQAIQEKVGKP